MTKQNTFLNDLRNEAITGVAYKNLMLKKQILEYFANISDATITDLSKGLNASIPKINELVVALIEDGLVKDSGKTEVGIGRRPSLYGLKSNSIFFVGVEVKKSHVNIGLSDFKKNLIKSVKRIPFQLTNSQASLDDLCIIIDDFIKSLALAENIAGIGVNLTGRINYKTGYSYSFFHFNEEPLSVIIKDKIGIRTYIENDSRAMAYGEFCSGIVDKEKNILFVNLDYGIGLGIMINGELYYGKSGFAGEFGHIQIFNNEIICHCGKKGCLETEASGSALLEAFKIRLQQGASSIITKDRPDFNDIQLEDIIQAANNDDTLAIELIAEIGEKLGRGIAALINLFNPELVILGGSLSATGDYLFLPVKSAINKYSLSLVNNDTELKMSKLGENAGIIGACLLVRERLLELK
ncbi:ROK family protein [Pedobacter cryoconitis]|uniref:Glucokinase-like ROK family protein n=1 Tax=Pedobacter cryoconitis TaxID=188932 RepID=A0A7X0J118_9SPHI|nr:ROK family protein [Pedobacter cryoconitis]MBB6498848.1 glucokinase-like ROK family protein [Pedobacter cryoconitis]